MTNESEFARAQAVIPGGVNSPVRAYRSVGGTPRFLVSARGPYVTDVEGRQYIDLVCSWGPALLGHAHPAVVTAVQDAAARGLSFGATTPGEAELAELLRERTTVLGTRLFDSIRLVSTGTEATMTAVRLARGATGRDIVIKFAGHYHGHSDGLLAESGSGVATLGLPGSAGVPAEVAALTIVLPYNDLAAVEATFAAHPGRIAAIITEAAGANAGVLVPADGFNQELAELAHREGALLILDEVLTGFRVGPAGWWGLEAERAGSVLWRPDLVTFGKIVGGGLPLAAVAGRAEIMDLLAPLGPVYQAGTLSGNPLAVAAGLATLRAADAAVYERIDHSAARLSGAVEDAFAAAGLRVRVSRAGSLFSLAFRDGAVRDYDDAKDQDGWRYRAFFTSMLDQGVSLPPSVFEAWFLSSAHTDVELDRIIAALPAAVRAASEEPSPEPAG
ncbi:glutamate-1-semialdehyde 2,1-aminomutase [Microbacterium sp. cf046]|uniref:glutamate-1-semialdehyde 2,1-aminomutase n=1 Tax=Microbacterium sp. cf046 TaxID=1761803 RepID=UPI0008EEBAA0|nr:glutamate-1-semialdehyde 2,1-aminomutase [Microbacterium sp. cf046]SFS15718.1 glutamate-1-semialdehyde 2,1-aminomutase [Microbacterium sp. cf046]